MSAVNQFEHSVRNVVRRGSRSVEFEGPIKEVAAHFADLVQEQIDGGATPSEAELIAKERIGTPLNIGLQILNTPSRTSKGLRLQKFAIAGLLIAAVEHEFLEYCGLQHWQGPVLTAFACIFFALYLFVVIQFGRGVVLAKRVLWLPVIASIPASILIFGIGHWLLQPMIEQYNRTSVGEYRSQLEFSPTLIFNVGVMFTERLIGFFVIIASMSFMVGRMWLTRLSWFRLTLR